MPEPGGSIPVFADSAYDILGRYIRFLDGNGIVSGSSISFQTPHPQVISAVEYVPFQYNDSESKWVEIPADEITGSDDISHTVTFSTTNPIIYAGKKRAFSTTTLYFDGGYVYSNKFNSVLRFDIGIDKQTSDITGAEVEVEYIDYSTNPSGIARTYTRPCQINTRSGDTLFEKKDQLVCPGNMKVQQVKLKLTSSMGDEHTVNYSGNYVIRTGQVLVMQVVNTAQYFISDPDPSRGISLYYYPCSETFESASFGDGRILFNTTVGDTDVYTYEYFLTDHLGSTRMVLNDQGSVTEAVMYHSYGGMVPVGGSSSAMPVREKFTTKEFDEEGRDSASGIPGIAAYYFGARYYDPEIGYWLSTDPADQYWNPYLYCGSDPINYIDPDGGWSAYLISQLIGVVSGAVVGGITGGIIAHKNDGNVALGIFGGIALGGAAGAFVGSGIGAGIESGWFNALGASLRTGLPLQVAKAAWDIANTAHTINDATQIAQKGGTPPTRYGQGRQSTREANQRAIMQAGPARNAPSRALEPREADFIVTPRGEVIPVPKGATGPKPTRSPGFQYEGGTGGGKGLDPRVTGVRVMDADATSVQNNRFRAVYMNEQGQTVNPRTGRTTRKKDPDAHHYLLPWDE